MKWSATGRAQDYKRGVQSKNTPISDVSCRMIRRSCDFVEKENPGKKITGGGELSN
ncbi:hypothetical protein ACP70R_026000 [Stipagrostis hirtigluma subsp. patula]